MNLLVEVRQVMFAGPFFDFDWLTIGPPIGIIAVPVTLVQPSLVVALELVIENDAIDAGAALGQAFRLPQVRTKHLNVMFHLTRLLELRVERLLAAVPRVVRVVTAMRFEDVAPSVRQDHGDIAVAIQRFGSDQTLLPQMPQIACPWVGRTSIVVAQVAGGDNPKRPYSRQRPRFRNAEHVLAMSGVVNNLSFMSTGQVEFAHEHVTRIEAPVSIA